MYSYQKYKSGFSLLEVTIVIVIIGLLAAGISAGSELISLANVRSVMEDTKRYSLGINQFRLKHGYLPGDFPHYTKYDTVCVDRGDNYCNGNGNGIIDNKESLRFWQHLTYFDSIPGENTKYRTLDHYRCYSPHNCPMPSGYVGLATSGHSAPRYSVGYFPFNGKSHLGFYLSINQTNNIGVMFPEDALRLDSMYDDGNPSTGLIRAVDGYWRGDYECVAGSRYLVDQGKNKGCRIYIKAFM